MKTLEQLFTPGVTAVSKILRSLKEPSLALSVGNYKVTVELLSSSPPYIASGLDGDAMPPLKKPLFLTRRPKAKSAPTYTKLGTLKGTSLGDALKSCFFKC